MEALNLSNKKCELHDVLRRSMRYCRWAGFFPVDGLDKEMTTDLSFNITSAYVLYHSTSIFFQALLACLSAYYCLVNDLRFDNLISLLFYLTGLLSAILLSKLAKNWPKLIKKAAYIESRVDSVRKNKPRTYGIGRAVMLFALLEHVLYVSFKFKSVMSGNKEFNINRIETYFIETLPQVFQIFTYTEWKAVLFTIANFQATFVWNFTDAVTMCLSLYISSYFQDLNKFIEHQEKQKTSNWKEIRIYYSYLVKLVHAVDKNMCYLILLSFFTNLFFICVQLFYLMMQFKNREFSLYFAYSFLFLFIRATITCLLAANVNTAARRPLIYLEYVPPSEYTLDVQRFIRQIRYTTTALSGLYFHITKGMILTVMGTIIKYELVMYQFNLRKYDENR